MRNWSKIGRRELAVITVLGWVEQKQYRSLSSAYLQVCPGGTEACEGVVLYNVLGGVRF